MGKVTGFLEIDRHDRKYKPAADRIRNYKEFVIPLGDTETKNQAARCMDCGIPFCHTGCPINNQIPDSLHHLFLQFAELQYPYHPKIQKHNLF